MPRRYENKNYHNATTNAQENLMGRTHYVDPQTLRWHKSKVLSAQPTDDGLLFAITTSDALDMHNTKRGFRYVVFNLFGDVVARPDLENTFRTHKKALKAMWDKLNEINAIGVTLAAIARAEYYHDQEMNNLRKSLETAP